MTKTMPHYPEETVFPPAESGGDGGVIGFSRDLTPGMLADAYRHGIFPWPCEESYVIWASPPMRGVLPLNRLHIPDSLRRCMKKQYPERFELRVNTAFDPVIRACAAAPRRGQDGTWITGKIISAYCEFHRLGFAHSFETFDRATGELAGGLYGVSIGGIFCGESMFHRVAGASKFAFLGLAGVLRAHGVELIDTQMVTPLTASFGAAEIPRPEYLALLERLHGDPLRLPSGKITDFFPFPV